MKRKLRNLVRARAHLQCEYCHIYQDEDSRLPFHVEHIVARQHGGKAVASNLALACNHCNLHKGPNISGLDKKNGKLSPLFNPRTDRWADHFAFRGVYIVGLTSVGRATVRVLAMNAPPRLQLRGFLRRRMD